MWKQVVRRQRVRFHSRLKVEWLEPRAMLAGNVLASVNAAGLLTITGDANANEVEVIQTAADTYLVTGVDTTINGGTEFEAAGVTGVSVDLRAGDDIFTFTGSQEEFT